MEDSGRNSTKIRSLELIFHLEMVAVFFRIAFKRGHWVNLLQQAKSQEEQPVCVCKRHELGT